MDQHTKVDVTVKGIVKNVIASYNCKVLFHQVIHMTCIKIYYTPDKIHSRGFVLELTLPFICAHAFPLLYNARMKYSKAIKFQEE